jgi:D-alanyl-lipoteichoic acid acyltransferase DltB (MBOAT superfamily)
MVLADNLGIIVNHFYGQPDANGVVMAFATVCFAFQIYCDFSGYTDIAIGAARWFGFSLTRNFAFPYFSQDLGEFWRRWHITLSTWFRDYVYIPLGGSRVGRVRQVWNAMVTFIISGLWHGASWNFVIWGALNGIGLVVYKLWRKISPWEKSGFRITHAWKILITLCFISFTRIFFRAPEMEIASDMMHQIGSGPYLKVIPQVFAAFWLYYTVMILGYCIHWLRSDFKIMYRHLFIRSHVLVKAFCCVVAVYIAYQSLQGAQPFIYFQF